jgi:peptidoglycan/xylan/chitin deacetylase (PgdA/CDA1 family)
MLDAVGVRATYYAAMRFLNEPTDFGDGFTVADLEGLIARGHELGCHTFDHLDATITEPGQYEASIRHNREAFARLLPGVLVESFAYPYGVRTEAAAAAARRYSRSARGTRGGTNVGVLDRNELRANKLYSERVPIQNAEELIRENRDARGWLIFYAHDVDINPSRYGCHPEYLRDALTAAVESGAVVLPVGSALSLIVSSVA